uniref:Uncharacterized protein n=1 Tax=Rhizophora mucronata TaxID=61149 RepID=A0A2P2N886_RHIMU
MGGWWYQPAHICFLLDSDELNIRSMLNLLYLHILSILQSVNGSGLFLNVASSYHSLSCL